MGGTYCVAYGCKKRCNKRGRSDSEGSSDEESEAKRKLPRTFHSFPADPVLRAKWVVNVNRQGWKPSPYSRICSDHFTEDSINRTCNIVRLKTGAFPTRFKLFPKHLKETLRSQCRAKQAHQPEPFPESDSGVEELGSCISPPDQLTPFPYFESELYPKLEQDEHAPWPLIGPHDQLSPDSEPGPSTNSEQDVEAHIALHDHNYFLVQSLEKLNEKVKRQSEHIASLKKKLRNVRSQSRRQRARIKAMETVITTLRKKKPTTESGDKAENRRKRHPQISLEKNASTENNCDHML